MKQKRIGGLFGVLLGLMLLAAVSAGVVHSLYQETWIQNKRAALYEETAQAEMQIQRRTAMEQLVENGCEYAKRVYQRLKAQTGEVLYSRTEDGDVGWVEMLLEEGRIQVCVLDEKSGKKYASSKEMAAEVADGIPTEPALDRMTLLLHYDENGEISGSVSCEGVAFVVTELAEQLQGGYEAFEEETPIAGLTLYLYAETSEIAYWYYAGHYNYYYRDTLHAAGYDMVVAAAVLAVLLGAVLLQLIRPLKVGYAVIGRIPLELALILGCLLVPYGTGLFEMTLSVYNGDVLAEGLIIPFVEMTPELLKGIGYAINGVLWFGFFALLYLVVVAFCSVFRLGLKKYALQNVWTIRLFAAIIRRLKCFFAELTRVDLTEGLHKKLLMVLGVNFVVLLFLCSIWFVGWVGVIVYSVLLYILLKRYLTKLQKDYAVIVGATSRMAQGHLEVGIQEDTGIFEPLKEELVKVQKGMKMAVEEEMKSERMKAELITNVSHDLKTPLTAIITYVNLLKEGNLTQEERENYIAVLDQKSERLKKLIEDLFEVSKANSNTVKLNLVEVNLVELIKEVQVELEDRLMASQVEFRLSCPEEKVTVTADSEKTYRIFSNLFVNIAKYAMPKTRAYIEVEEEEEFVLVGMKNISAAELTFHAEEITERFVRGDEARNTEGSGLGLAIVKSFMEVMGGRMTVETDGDLFKVKLWFKK